MLLTLSASWHLKASLFQSVLCAAMRPLKQQIHERQNLDDSSRKSLSDSAILRLFPSVANRYRMTFQRYCQSTNRRAKSGTEPIPFPGPNADLFPQPSHRRGKGQRGAKSQAFSVRADPPTQTSADSTKGRGRDLDSASGSGSSPAPSPRSAGRGRGEAAGVRVGRVLDLKWPWASS